MIASAARPTLRGEFGKLVRANLSSGLASAVDWGIASGLVWAGTFYLGAVAAGASVGALTDFVLKRHWAFPRGRSRAPIHHEGLRYFLTSAGTLGLNLAGTWAVVDKLHAPPIPGYIFVSVLVGLGWSYPVQRWFVFRHLPAMPNRSEGAGKAP